MKFQYLNWAVIIPMANESAEFQTLCSFIAEIFSELKSGTAYLVIDNVSRDNTLELATNLSEKDVRFQVVWAPQNKSVVDAYIKGFETAYNQGHELIIEMDANMSHNPRSLPLFLKVLSEGKECAFGSRFIDGGSMGNSPINRKLLSRYSTILANMLLGTKLKDMTSGYQGFQRHLVSEMIRYKLKSTGHFYQTELRYLLRKRTYAEVPIHYQAPSPCVSSASIKNAYRTLWYYFKLRLSGNRPTI